MGVLVRRDDLCCGGRGEGYGYAGHSGCLAEGQVAGQFGLEISYFRLALGAGAGAFSLIGADRDFQWDAVLLRYVATDGLELFADVFTVGHFC